MLLVPANGLWPSLITMKTYNQGLLCQALALREQEKSNSGKGRAESTGGEGMAAGEGNFRVPVWGRKK